MIQLLKSGLGSRLIPLGIISNADLLFKLKLVSKYNKFIEEN